MIEMDARTLRDLCLALSELDPDEKVTVYVNGGRAGTVVSAMRLEEGPPARITSAPVTPGMAEAINRLQLFLLAYWPDRIDGHFEIRVPLADEAPYRIMFYRKRSRPG